MQVDDILSCRPESGTVALTVRGTLPGVRPGSLLGVMDLGFAQWRLGGLGRLTRIDLRLADGVSLETLRARLDLPPGVNLAGPDATSARLANLSRAYRVNLNVLALVALFTGGFLVFRCRRRPHWRGARSLPGCAQPASSVASSSDC